MTETERLKKDVTKIVAGYSLDQMLLKSKGSAVSNWEIQGDTSKSIYELLNILNEEYTKVSLETKRKINSYDGYLLPLRGERYLRVMKFNNSLVGLVYYFSGHVIRVVGEISGERYSCSLYKTGVIRGCEVVGG